MTDSIPATDQAAPELLPCRWCGHSSAETGRDPQRHNLWHVFCAECDASGPTHETEAEAVAAWNRRADLAAPSAQPVQSSDKWLIYKEGRGWYRPNAQGYTCNSAHAGRYSREDALSHSHPNGLNGPRDGVTIHHEREIFTSAEPYAISPETEEVYAAIAKSLGRGGYAVYDDAPASPAAPSAPAERDQAYELFVFWRDKADQRAAEIARLRDRAEKAEAALKVAGDAISGIAEHILENRAKPSEINWRGVFADCQREGIATRTALADHANLKGGV